MVEIKNGSPKFTVKNIFKNACNILIKMNVSKNVTRDFPNGEGIDKFRIL